MPLALRQASALAQRKRQVMATKRARSAGVAVGDVLPADWLEKP